MAISNLNKLFVRVPLNSTATVLDISVASTQSGNISKIYFLEKYNQIVNNGVVYGVDPTTAQSLKDLIAVVGQEKLATGDTVDASTVVERLAKLEAIKVNSASASYLNVSDGTGFNSPEIGVKIQSLDLASEPGQGLVDAVNAKTYIDTKAAAATTKVKVGKGLTVTSAKDASNASVYTIAPNLQFVHVPATASEGAKIELKSGDDVSVLATFNVADIVGDGVLRDSSYDKDSGILTLYFNTAETTDSSKPVQINLAEMLDINDMSIANDSSKYLNVVLDGGAESQAVFSTKMQDPSTSDAEHTGLADAYLVKQYVDSKTTDLAVTALGDSYISAVQDKDNKKQIDVSANMATVTFTKGTIAETTIADDGTITTTIAAVKGNISATENKLLDASHVGTLAEYVDGEVAIETKNRQDAVESLRKTINTSIQALDASLDVTETGGNIHVGAKQVDGKLTELVLTTEYANVTKNANADDPASFTVETGHETKLVKASDLVTLKNYTDEKIAESTTDSSVKAQGDSFVSATVDAVADNKKVNVSTNIDQLTVTTTDGVDSTLTGVGTTLVSGGEIATKVSQFTNARITEEIAKLDSSITKSDVSGYVTVQTVITDGSLNNTDSLVDVSVGNFDDKVYGLATVADVSTLVNTYDYWETYSAS